VTVIVVQFFFVVRHVHNVLTFGMIYCSFEIYYPFLDPEQAQGSHVFLKHSYLHVIKT